MLPSSDLVIVAFTSDPVKTSGERVKPKAKDELHSAGKKVGISFLRILRSKVQVRTG